MDIHVVDKKKSHKGSNMTNPLTCYDLSQSSLDAPDEIFQDSREKGGNQYCSLQNRFM